MWEEALECYKRFFVFNFSGNIKKNHSISFLAFVQFPFLKQEDYSRTVIAKL